MRRPRRNIEIFSMSVLDMFASALGAFIMVSIILFPYYQKNKPIKQLLDQAMSELAQMRNEVEKTQAAAARIEVRNDDLKSEIRKVQLAQVELNQCKQGVAACLIERGATFLLIKIEWTEPVDVDLHVKDPDGNEFFFMKTNRNGRTFPNSQGRLSTDTVGGPGVEVWQIPRASVGSYVIEYVVESEPGRPVTVNGIFFDKTGKKQLPEKTLGNGRLRVTAGTVDVGADGHVTLH